MSGKKPSGFPSRVKPTEPGFKKYKFKNQNHKEKVGVGYQTSNFAFRKRNYKKFCGSDPLVSGGDPSSTLQRTFQHLSSLNPVTIEYEYTVLIS